MHSVKEVGVHLWVEEGVTWVGVSPNTLKDTRAHRARTSSHTQTLEGGL